jgi:hypothetical protein
VRPNLFVQDTLWFANNQQTIVLNANQDLIASMFNDFFQGQIQA